MYSKQNRRFKSKRIQHDYRNKRKNKQKINLVVENIIQIKSGIRINVDASAKHIYLKKVIFGILLHVVVKRVNI